MNFDFNKKYIDTSSYNKKKSNTSDASKGRFGDTKMRKVGGRKSHVTAWEALLIDDYGKWGEKIVKESGSGTINPSTGKPEYSPLAAVSLGLQVFSMLGGASKKSKANKAKQAQLTEGIASMNQERGVMEQDFGESVTNLWESIGDKLDATRTKIGEGYDQLASGVGSVIQRGKGLLTGEPEAMVDKTTKKVQTDLDQQSDMLFEEGKDQITDMNKKFNAETREMDRQMEEMRRESASLDTSFLGNIFG